MTIPRKAWVLLSLAGTLFAIAMMFAKVLMAIEAYRAAARMEFPGP